MKEIIINITADSAMASGHKVVISNASDYSTLGKNNVLGILNKTRAKSHYTLMQWADLTSVVYNSTYDTLTLNLAASSPAITAGDELFVKLYNDADLATELQATANKEEVKQHVRNVAGNCVIPDFESPCLPFEVQDGFCALDNDLNIYVGDFEPQATAELIRQLYVGAVIKVTGDNYLPYATYGFPVGTLMSVAKTVSSEEAGYGQGLYWDFQENEPLHGVTETIQWEKDHCYRITGFHDIYDMFGSGIKEGYVITYEEVEATITDLGKQLADKMSSIQPDLSNVAKQSNVGTSSDQASESGSTLFAVLKAVWNKVVDIITNYPYAKESSVKNGNNTAISMLEDSTNGLAAIKMAAASAATATNVSTAQGNILGTDGTNADNTTLKTMLNTINTNMYKGVPINTISGTSATIAPNTWNIWSSEQTAAFTITKGSDVSGVLNEWVMHFSLGSSWAANTQITFSGWNNLQWNGGSVPTWTASKTYEVNIVDNIAMWAEV